MRDLVFLVADKNMESMVKGFFGRDGWHRSLGCAKINLDLAQEVVVTTGDTAVFHKAHGLLQTYQKTHAHAVVMIDNDWAGSRGPAAIQQEIGQRLLASGWGEDSFVVLVLDPEIEVWFWQRNPNVEEAVWPRQWSRRPEGSLFDWLEQEGLLRPGKPKPVDPKHALELALRRVGRPRSSAIYHAVAENVSTKGCRDGAFQGLCAALRTWFPPEAT